MKTEIMEEIAWYNSAFRRLRKEDQEFRTSLDYITSGKEGDREGEREEGDKKEKYRKKKGRKEGMERGRKVGKEVGMKEGRKLEEWIKH
jgi:hypothetical protein